MGCNEAEDKENGFTAAEAMHMCSGCGQGFDTSHGLACHLGRYCSRALQQRTVLRPTQPTKLRTVLSSDSEQEQATKAADDSYQVKVALTTAKWRQRASMSGAACEHVKKGTAELHRTLVSSLLEEVKLQIEECGDIDTDLLMEKYGTLYPSMGTNAEEIKLLRSIFSTIKPVKRSLGIFKEKKKFEKGKQAVKVDVEHFVVDFPFKDVLEQLLSCPAVLAGIDAHRAEFRDKKSADGVIRSFRDGWKFKSLAESHTARMHPDAYACMSYEDSVTYTDPCSAYGQQSLSMTYWALLEMPVAYQGLSELVFVSSICWSRTLKVCGPHLVIGGGEEDPYGDSFGAHLKELKSGCWLETARGLELVRVYLLLHSADTPAANVYAGKMETCTKTKHFCRLCFAEQHQRLIPDGSVGFVSALFGRGECAYRLRDPEEDEEQHARVRAGECGKQWGISNTLKGATAFMNALSRGEFDSSMCLTPDGMHIGPEGCIPTEFRRFLWWLRWRTNMGQVSF